MGLFGGKKNPESADAEKLASRTPEVQVAIDQWFAYLRGDVDEKPVMTFQAIMSVTSQEKAEAGRLSQISGRPF